MGSSAYMAPEQVEARHDEIGPQTDVYALGVILCQLIVGGRPFEGSVASIFGQIVSRDPDPPSKRVHNLPPDFDSVCRRAIAKSPSQRQPTAVAFADDMLRLLPQCDAALATLIYHSETPVAEVESRPQRAAGSHTGSSSPSKRDAQLQQVTIAHFNFESDDSLPGEKSGSQSEVLHRHSQLFEEFVRRRLDAMGGTVISDSGQEVIACFGFPLAFEDASQRAVLRV